MATSRITFPGFAGNSLAARLETPPDGKVSSWALFAHCFTCSKDLRAAVALTRGLSARGMGVVRFDFTGLGESEGDFEDTDFSSNVEDLVAAGRWMAEVHDAPQLLVGHSLGGAAVLHAAHRLPSVRAVATIGAPSDPSHVLRHMEGSLETIEREGEATVEIGGRPFKVRDSFIRDLEASSMEEVVTGLDAALLVLHSPVDRIVGVDNAARLYEMARHPKSFVSLDDADHLLSRREDAGWVAGVLASWSGRYVDLPSGEEDEEGLRSGDRVVTWTGPGSFRTEIQVRRHGLVADEPESMGGGDEGPSPYDLVVAGLGACTSMTLRMYADRKGWPLEEVRVRLRHRKLHGDDERACEEGEDARLDLVDRELELTGPLDTEQVARLLEIADRCPVHRTLDAGVRVETRLRSDGEPDEGTEDGADEG